jgi:hypothetical protein
MHLQLLKASWSKENKGKIGEVLDLIIDKYKTKSNLILF